MPKIIETIWLSYDKMLPKDAGPTQHIETRRAFYAGAWALFELITTGLTADKGPTDEDFLLLDAISAELKEFPNMVRRGEA